jgi:hypothetical protein
LSREPQRTLRRKRHCERSEAISIGAQQIGPRLFRRLTAPRNDN